MTTPPLPLALSRPWLGRYEAAVPQDYQPSERTLPELLISAAERFPERDALRFVGKATSYRALLEQARQFASALQGLGVQPGDRVAIMLPNSPQFVVSFFGTLLAGGVVVNTSPLYTASELEHQLKDSGASVLVLLDPFLPRYREIRAGLALKRVLVTGIQDALPFPKNLLYPLKARKDGTWVKTEYGGEVASYSKFLASGSGTPRPVPVTPDDVALLQYTGGTTGVPKGTMLTHRNLVSNAEQSRAWISELREGEEITLAAIPFFHVYGMTVALNLSLLIGATLVLIPNPRDIEMVLKEISGNRATLFPGVPTLYNAINHHPKTASYDLTSVRACISGSAPLLLETARRFRELTGGANLVEGYGLTEASPVTHVNPVFGDQKEGSIGLPLPGVDALVVTEAGEAVPTGEIGELWVAGPMVMKGYWQRPDETAKTMGEAYGRSWLKTGDMARMDEDGYFSIVDRKKELIIAGGYNIYPREVEEALVSHPAVMEAAAVGLPDEYRGESVHGVVVLRPGAKASEAELREHCRTLLSPYKVPRSIEFRDELPKTAALKVLRRQLAEEARARLGK